jgi:hypothetical protein
MASSISEDVLFQFLIPGVTSISLLERESGFKIVTQLADTVKIDDGVNAYVVDETKDAN